MEKINTLLIGVGYHARRIYLPSIKSTDACNLMACWDLISQKNRVFSFLKEVGVSAPCYFAEYDKLADTIDLRDKKILDSLIEKYSIQAVIISTEPLAHLKYIKWALNNNLHILSDKPISTEIDISTDIDKAQKIFNDYKELEKLYIKKKNKHNIVFNIQAQRRFHAGYKLIKEKIIEIAQLSHCPVTSMQTFHADGQWTFPSEFLDQTYHPYNQGYGKMSHSGFHTLDIAFWLADASLMLDKKWDNFKVHTTFTRPQDILVQFSRKDYIRTFPKMEWDKRVNKNINQITGEVDAFTHVVLLRGENIITNINCNTLHNSFSRRGWVSSVGRDLYKGNGRVRQESYIIEQGPFQSIIINSLQSKEIQKDNTEVYGVGGEYHFDVHIFRNQSLFPKLKAYEYINLQSLSPVENLGYSRGHQEDARRNCISDFFASIINKIPIENQGGNFLSYKITTQILSAIYVSAARQYNKQCGEIEGTIENVISSPKSYIKLPIIAQSIIFKKTGSGVKILLLKRNEERGGFWNVVNGTLEINESFINCRDRELYEETGIKKVISWSGEIHRFSFTKSNKTYIVVVFAGEVSKGQKIKINEEHTEYNWVDFKKAFSLLKFKDDRKSLESFLSKVVKKL